MSYRVEVTAASVTELAGKLLALAATMQATPVDPVMAEVKASTKPKKGKAETSADTAVGTGSTIETKTDAQPAAETQTEAAPVSSDDVGNAASSAEKTTGATAAASGAATSDGTSTSTVPADAEPLDFDKDVAPVVLGAVRDHGKPWVQEVLSQFGFERASQVPEEQLPELVATLSAGPQG